MFGASNSEKTKWQFECEQCLGLDLLLSDRLARLVGQGRAGQGRAGQGRGSQWEMA